MTFLTNAMLQICESLPMRTIIILLSVVFLWSCSSPSGASQVTPAPDQQLLQWVKTQPAPNSLQPFFDFIATQSADSTQQQYWQSLFLAQVLNQEKGWETYSAVVDVSTVALLDFKLGKYNPHRALYADALQHYYTTRQLRYAADFTAVDTNGNAIQLSAFGDKVIYIDTWASWCGPCMQQLPYLHALAEHYADQPDFLILTVSFDRSFEAWKRALSKQAAYPNIFPVYVEGGMDSDYGSLFSISSIPSYALLGRSREVIDMSAPKPGVDSLKLVIEGVLGKP